MPTGIPRLLALLHPIIAVLAILLVAHAATLGLRTRQRHGAASRPVHRRRARLALALIWVTLFSGLLATWLWRPDLDLAAGPHFWFGVLVTLVLSGGALLSYWVPHNPRARKIHPALGLLALLLATLQIFFGMPLLPF